MHVQYVRQLEFTAGQTVRRDLNAIETLDPMGRPLYIEEVILKIPVTLTSANPSDAITVSQWCNLVEKVSFTDNTGRNFLTDSPVSGKVLRTLSARLKRRGYIDPAALGADTNQSNTRILSLHIPLRLPHLQDASAHLPLAAMLRGGNVEITWAASTIYGTGQVIASALCEVILVCSARKNWEIGPRLFYGSKTPENFDQYRLNTQGKVIGLVAQHETYSSVFAVNDFTAIEIQGSGIRTNRQGIDNPSVAFNADTIDDGSVVIPTLATSQDLMLYFSRKEAKLSELAIETAPKITLTTGAGNPGVADQTYAYVVSRPVDEAAAAESLGKASDVPFTQVDVLNSIAEDPAGVGLGGSSVMPDDPMFGWTRRKINLG
jgi:hypothetical protein